MQSDPATGMKKTHLMWMCVLMAAAVLGAVLFVLPFTRPHGLTNAQPLLSGWGYTISPGETSVDVETLDDLIPFDPKDSITLTRRMAERSEDPHLLLRLTYVRATVTLDGAPLFESPPDLPGGNPGSGMHLIALPEDYLGRELSITIASPYEDYAVTPDPIYFGDTVSLSLLVLAHSARDVALMFVLVIAGFILMGVELFGARAGRPVRARWANFCFGLFAVLYGFSLVTIGDLFLVVCPPWLRANVEFTLWYLFPLPLVCYLWLKCAVYKRAGLCLAAYWALITLPALLGGAFGFWTLPAATTVTNRAYIVGMLAVGVLVALEAVRKNAIFRLMIPAIALLLGSAALSVFGVLYTVKEALRIGGILLLLALAAVDGVRGLIAAHRREEGERQLVAAKAYLAEERLKASAAYDQETRLLRHEIRHHLSALTLLQNEGRFRDMGSYLSELNLMEETLEPSRYCEHPLANAILSKISTDCARAGIAFSCEAQVPSGLSVSDSDLSALLLNMLENAVDAAMLAPEGNRWVAAQVHCKEGFLVISCRNARRGALLQQEGRFLSTKRDTRFHGYGMLAMRKIAERHGSKLNIDYDDTSFSVRTILPLEGPEGKVVPESAADSYQPYSQ